MLSDLRADYRRYLLPALKEYGSARAHVFSALRYGFLATAVYRFGRWTRTIRPRWLSYPFKALYMVLDTMVEILFGISISANSDIGPGLYIGHFGNIIVCADLGANCSIGQGVTIGSKGAGKSNGYPVLGDNVFMGAGAMVIGRVRIGDDVIIGANTVVVQDVPDRHRVVSAAVRITPLDAGSGGPQVTDRPE
jgi:serine O-acetyltransferase